VSCRGFGIPSEDESLNLLEIFTGLIVLVSGATNELVNAVQNNAAANTQSGTIETQTRSDADACEGELVSKPEATPAVSPEVHENITSQNPNLDPTEHVDRVAALISSNEGDPDSICWNDNGHGVSVGMFQANQKKGELPNLLKSLAERPDGRRQMLNAFGAEMTEKIENDPEIVRHLQIKPNNWLGKGLKLLVKSDSFAQLQIDLLRAKVRSSSEFAAAHGITSTLGVAIVADLRNQWGKGGAARFIKSASSCSNEATKLKVIVNKVDDTSIYGDRYRGDLEKAPLLGLSVKDEFELNS
jgi:hypothetical protein